jgi:hypothetical protein
VDGSVDARTPDADGATAQEDAAETSVDAPTKTDGKACCPAGEGYGGLPTTHPSPCEGCCAGLVAHSTVVGPGDVGVTCERPDAAPEAGKACVTSADCAEGSVCGYPLNDGCAGQGTCLDEASPCTIAAEDGCACDGTVINITSCNVGLPGGYTTKPLAYAGACTSMCTTPSDGGVGSPCTSTSECGGDELCAWPMSASCAVSQSLGRCVEKTAGCHCVTPAACGCDGQPAETGCSVFLPIGYSLSPFAHTGACGDAG